MSNKGGQYEREKAVQLSLWASGGKHDDWFWRSSQSGGRATTRAKRGKKTEGHCSDLCSTCPESAWLMELFAIECKKGYGDHGNPFNVIDRLAKAKQGAKATFHGFILQAEEARERSGSCYWMLIYRRPQKQDMVYLPIQFWWHSRSKISDFVPAVRMDFMNGEDEIGIGGVLLDSFLTFFKPKTLKKLLA